jgi:hypothetical protein
MKEKILARFKAKFPAVNLSKVRLDALAAKLEPKITDESQIDAQLDALNDAYAFEDIAKSDDQIRDLNGKLKKAADPAKPKDKTDADESKPDADKSLELPADTPPWAKTVIESNNKVLQRIAAIEGDKVKGTIKEKATAALKKVPQSYWSKRALPEKEEDLETFVKEVNEDYSAFKKELVSQGLAVQEEVGGSDDSGDKKPVKEATKEEVSSIVKNIM